MASQGDGGRHIGQGILCVVAFGQFRVVWRVHVPFRSALYGFSDTGADSQEKRGVVQGSDKKSRVYAVAVIRNDLVGFLAKRVAFVGGKSREKGYDDTKGRKKVYDYDRFDATRDYKGSGVKRKRIYGGSGGGFLVKDYDG